MISLQHKFNKSVHNMALHEELIAEPLRVTEGGIEYNALPLRVLGVPGGWIYYNTDVSSTGVFVPDQPMPTFPRGPRP